MQDRPPPIMQRQRQQPPPQGLDTSPPLSGPFHWLWWRFPKSRRRSLHGTSNIPNSREAPHSFRRQGARHGFPMPTPDAPGQASHVPGSEAHGAGQCRARDERTTRDLREKTEQAQPIQLHCWLRRRSSTTDPANAPSRPSSRSCGPRGLPLDRGRACPRRSKPTGDGRSRGR